MATASKATATTATTAAKKNGNGRKLPPVERVLVVAKRSSYDNYVRRYKMERVRELLRTNDPSVARLVRADQHHGETLAELREILGGLKVRARFRDRSQIGDVSGFDLVITVGGDGTMLSSSHALGTTPIFGINSAPYDSVGFLCSARRGALRGRVRDAIRGKLPVSELARMRVQVDNRVVHQRVLNDVLYAHKSPAMTARYLLRFRGTDEEHKSSGIWIGPAAGSTAAIRSAGGRLLPARSKLLQFVVREPYHPRGGEFALHKGLVRPGESLSIINAMREAMLYIDGPRISVPLEIGQRVTFDLSPERLRVVGYDPGTSAHG